MSIQTVLLVGGTGRTGSRVLVQLLNRGINVRIIVRSVQKLPKEIAERTNLTVVEADLLSLGDGELRRLLQGCDAVISCLGHVLSLKGIWGPPHDLVTKITVRLCQGIEAIHPVNPVHYILMSSVSVNHPADLETRRGMFEKAFVWLIRCLLPPANDNQKAANYLYHCIGMTHPYIQWTAVRPDSLLEGDVSDYTLNEGLVNSLFAPGSTTIANVAHFMCDLVVDPKVWQAWNGKFPVIVNATPSGR